jgi:hypothetical protein
MKTETLKKNRAQKQLELAGQVCAILKKDEHWISNVKFETACLYMEGLLDGNDAIAREFLREKMFWGWWKQQWALIDELWIARAVKTSLSPELLQAWYMKMHLELDKYPDDIVWEQVNTNYMQMVAAIIEKNAKQ